MIWSVIGIPALLIVLFAAGLAALSVPLLVLALLAAFLWPVSKGIEQERLCG